MENIFIDGNMTRKPKVKLKRRTYIHKPSKKALGFKAIKDRPVFVFCANATGLMLKTVYQSYNPRALKTKNKDSLSAFLQSNPKAWISIFLFTK